MPVRKTIPEKDGVYFITFTCVQWLPLFQVSNGYDAVYKLFDVLKKNGHFIIGYTIMTNHVRAVIAFHNSEKTINSIIGNGKRFIAYDIVKRLKNHNQNVLLSQMQSMVNNTQKEDNKLHEVFEPSFDLKECRTSAFIQQKLNYMHWNPCKGDNKLVELPEQYIHSSAKLYITGEQSIYPVTSYMELEDIDLTK